MCVQSRPLLQLVSSLVSSSGQSSLSSRADNWQAATAAATAVVVVVAGGAEEGQLGKSSKGQTMQLCCWEMNL